jgi:lia operon protein LiaG
MITMTTSRASRFGLAAAVAALAVHSIDAQTERRTLAGSSVAIYDLAGHVQVEQGPGSEVVVEITRGGRDAKKLTIDVGELRGRNTLRVRYPDDDIVYPDIGRWSNSDFRVNSDGTWDDGDRGDRGDRSRDGRRVRITGNGTGTEAWADLRILVPAGKDVAVYVGVGELGATRVNANLRLSVASARLTVNGTTGNLVVSAGSGGVDARGATGDEVTIESGSGGVTVTDVSGKRLTIQTGSGGVAGSGLTADDLDIGAGSGSIRVDDARAPRAHVNSGSGFIRVGFAAPVRSLDATTGSGGVTVTLPAPVNAEVDIQTGSGGIDSDFPVQVNRMERNQLRGQIGDGSGHIRIRSGSGSVHLRKL